MIPEDDTHLVEAIALRKKRIQDESDSIRKSIVENNYDRMVERFEQYFDNYLKDLLSKLQEKTAKEKLKTLCPKRK